jgi:hypothetical protein
MPETPESGPPKSETIRDPALAGWLYGSDFSKAAALQDFTLTRLKAEPDRAWLLPAKELDATVDPFALIAKFRGASPLPYHSDVPERVEVEVLVNDPTPSMVVLSKTFDPEWRAGWSSPSGDRRFGEVVQVLGGWQGVAVPGPGQWTLHLEYPGRAVWIGLAVSGLAWLVWVVVFVRMGTEPVSIGVKSREVS